MFQDEHADASSDGACDVFQGVDVSANRNGACDVF